MSAVTHVMVTDTRVIVTEGGDVQVVTVGSQGPPGYPGYSSFAPPLTVQNDQLKLALGTAVGQGLIWNGSAWVNTQVVPSGTGTIPYTTAAGALAGTNADLRYDATVRSLVVPAVDGAVINGGTF